MFPTITIYQIAVLAAFFAQAFAIFTAKELLGNAQQYLFANELGQVQRVALQFIRFEVRYVDLVLAAASQPSFGQVIDVEIDGKRLLDWLKAMK